MILARQILRKFDMKILQVCLPHLLDVATLPWEIQKSHFQQYYSYILLIRQTVHTHCACVTEQRNW